MSNGAKLSILGLYNWDNTIFDLMVFPVWDQNEFSTEEKNLVINNIMAECAELEILYPNPVVMKNMIGLWSAKEQPTWNRIYRVALNEYDPLENYHRTEHATETLDHSDTHSGNDVNRASGTDSTTGGFTDTNSGNDVNQASGTDSTTGGFTDTNSGTDTTNNKFVGYDSGTLVDHDESDLQHGHVVTNTHNDGTTYGKTDTFTHGHVVTNTHNDGTTYGRTDTLTHGEKIEHGGTIKNDIEAFGNIGVTTSQQMAEAELLVSPKLNVYNYIIESFKNRFCLLVF